MFRIWQYSCKSYWFFLLHLSLCLPALGSRDILFNLVCLSIWPSITRRVLPCSTAPSPVLARSFWNFACGFGQCLNIRMIFGCNPQKFWTLVAGLTLSFLDRLLPKHIDTGNLKNAKPPKILPRTFWNFAGVFFQGLKMCRRFACNSQIVCYFFCILHLVFF